MINLLYVSQSAGVHTGSPRALLDLVANLDRERFRPHLMVPEPGELAEAFSVLSPDVHYRRSMSLSMGSIASFGVAVLAAARFLRQSNIDIVHFNGIGWRESLVVAAGLLRIPVVLHLHNPYPRESISSNFNFRIASKLFIVSESMRDNFLDRPAVGQKIVCVYNGVDTQRFHPKLARKPEDAGPVVGFVGQIAHRKGLDVLVEAAPMISSAVPDVRFCVVGGEGVGEEGLRAVLERRIEDLGMQKHFSFFGSRHDIPELMAQMDVLAVPSRAEPFGKVVIEAMACGTCVVATSVGGIPEIIQPRENGILVAPGDAGALGKAIQELLIDSDTRMRFAREGCIRAQTMFSIASVVEKTQTQYERLVRPRARSGEAN